MIEKRWLQLDTVHDMLSDWTDLTLPRPPAKRMPKPSDRKFRLFAVALCRLAWEHFEHDYRTVIVALEDYADRKGRLYTLSDPHFYMLTRECNRSESEIGRTCKSSRMAAVNSHWNSANFRGSIESVIQQTGQLNVSSQTQADLARAIFGNPFRPYVLDSFSCTPRALRIAREAYQERLPDGELNHECLLVLSDALLDEGWPDRAICPNCEQGYIREDDLWGALDRCWRCKGTGSIAEPVLDSLRTSRKSFRGLWSLDLILGKK